MYSNIKQQISTMQKLQLLLHLINVFEVILFTTKCHMTSGISSMELCLVRTQHCPRACFLTLLISMNDSSGQGFSLIRSLPWNMHRWVTSVYSGPVLCGRCRVGVKVKSLSRVWLFVTPWTVAHQAPPFLRFSRQEYWSGLPFPSSGDLPNPGIEPRSPAL